MRKATISGCPGNIPSVRTYYFGGVVEGVVAGLEPVPVPEGLLVPNGGCDFGWVVGAATPD